MWGPIGGHDLSLDAAAFVGVAFILNLDICRKNESAIVRGIIGGKFWAFKRKAVSLHLDTA
jgi:hypothetical protein